MASGVLIALMASGVLAASGVLMGHDDDTRDCVGDNGKAGGVDMIWVALGLSIEGIGLIGGLTLMLSCCK